MDTMINSDNSTPILSTPIKFGESCSDLIFNITLPEGMINISDQPILNKDSLERLLIFLKKNIKVGSVIWNEEQDRFDYTFCKIIKQLKKNNERFNYHPTDYIAGVLSSHVYLKPEILAKRIVDYRDIPVINRPTTTSSQFESINSYLGQLEIINYLNDDGFQYALYENKEMHHLILAFRGTVVTNLREFALTLFEDAYMITLRNKDSFQSKMVTKVVSSAVELCNKKHYHLTIVGHSLGAFLAELAHYHCFYSHQFTHVKTITFDSPGALDQFKVIDNQVPPTIPYEAMYMISYLSEPNFINCMNNHIFENNTTFRIYPTGVDQVDDSKFDFVIGAKFHSLGLILDCFDFETGKPSKYKVVKKWPLIDTKNMPSYLSYFKNNDNDALEKPGLSEELAKQVHYQVLEIDNYVGNLSLLDSFKIDKLLIQLSIKNFFSQFNDYFISTQLKELKQLYHVNENTLSITNQSITFELLKQRIARIVNLNPKEISKMLNSSSSGSGQLDSTTTEYKIRLNHLSIDGFYDSDDYIGKLSEIHKISNLAIITGEEGSGKSAIALEYATNHLPNLSGIVSSQFNEFKVLFIRGGSKEMIFEDFANHLLKNYQNEHNGYDFQLSSNHLIDFYKVLMDSQNTFYTFIFDNVEDLSLVEPFLFYLPKVNTKSIITSQVKNGIIERVLSLGKQVISDITMNVKLLDNRQANQYLQSRGIQNSNCNFSSPISIHLLNILINSYKSIQANNGNGDNAEIDFNKTLSKLMFDFINVNPESVKLLNVLPFLDPESISYDIISQIDSTIEIGKIVEYWSKISIINDLPGEKINTYKYIQQLIMDEILEQSEKQLIITKLIGIYSRLSVSGQHPKGWRIYLSHLKYFYNNFNSHCLDNVQIIENLGICFKLCSQFQESIKILSVALEIKKKNGSSNNEISTTLYQIANTYHKSLDYEQALTYYSMVLSNCTDNDVISHTYNEIGDCQFNLNHTDIALELFEKSLSIAPNSDFDLISSIHLNIGDVYLEKNQLINAKQEFIIALETIGQVSIETSPILSKSYFKLAMIEFLQSNFKLAIEKFNKSIQLYKELFKSSLHKNVATSFEKIGLCYLNDTTIEKDAGVLLSSLDNLKQSLNIRLKIHRTNLNHQDLLSSYSNLAKCYKKRLEYKESYQCLRKCYEIQKVNNGNQVLILQSLSTISFLSKDYQGSIDYSTKLLNNHLENIDKFTLASIYKNIGENYKLLGTFDQAILNFEKSIEITTELIASNEKGINISTTLKKKGTNSNLDLLLSTLKLYEFIGSIYYSEISITVNTDKKKLLSNSLHHYFNILLSFEKLKLIDSFNQLLSTSNWYIQYKNSNSTFLTIKKLFIISTILIVLISYYQLNKQ